MSALALHFALPTPAIAAWRAGNTGVEGVWQFDSHQPGRDVLITALVHGNELCGAWALKGLLEAGVRPCQGTLTLAFCNLAAFDRFDPTDHDASRFVDEDLNRQWQLERIESGGSLERRRAAELHPFVANADWLLDLHSMHERSAPLLLTGMQARNLELAKQLRTPRYIVVDAGHKDGVRMRDFGRFGVLAPEGDDAQTRSLLLECGFHGDVSSRTVARDMCARFLEAADMLQKSDLQQLLPGWLQADCERQWVLEVTDAVVASSTDFRFAAPYQGLECIAKAGTVIAWDGPEPVATPYDDCVLVMPSIRQAKPGVTVTRFARRRPL